MNLALSYQWAVREADGESPRKRGAFPMERKVNMRKLHTSVVEAAFQAGYPLYRIPGIVATETGALLVGYEARNTLASRGMGDWAVIDLYVKRSVDGGRTWQPRVKLLDGLGKNTTNNPVFIVDGGRIHFIGMENYKRAFHRVSDDDGLTWSKPMEITSAFDEARGQYDWTVIAAGPGHGMRLSNGRLIVPVWYTRNLENITAHNPSACGTIYSDDGGKTWHAGDVLKPDFLIDPNESAVAELSDGRVLINMRSVRPGKAFAEHRGIPEGEHYRAVAVSRDGATNWTDAHFDTNLRDPVCASGLANCPGGILYSGCDSERSRTCLTLRFSPDDGASWTDSLMYETLGGYSDVCYNAKTGTAFVAYEYDDYRDLRVSEIALDASNSQEDNV